MERRQITFRGRVQGVGFRATASAMASGFKITGWVRNEPDGTVLLEVQGQPDEIDDYLDGLRDRLGRLISGEDSLSVTVVPEELGFEVRR
jgi:acylphosphatase